MLARAALLLAVPRGAALSCRLAADKSSYDGYVSETKGGQACQPWKEKYPHNSFYPSEPENYCRNPDGDANGPW